MTTTYQEVPLSASTDFRGIKVVGVASNGSDATTLHAAQASPTLPDLLHLEFCNTDTVARPLTLFWGGVTVPDDVKRYLLLPGETRKVEHQIPIRNSLIVKAASVTATWIDGVSYTGAANVIVCTGGSYVQRQLT